MWIREKPPIHNRINEIRLIIKLTILQIEITFFEMLNFIVIGYFWVIQKIVEIVETCTDVETHITDITTMYTATHSTSMCLATMTTHIASMLTHAAPMLTHIATVFNQICGSVHF